MNALTFHNDHTPIGMIWLKNDIVFFKGDFNYVANYIVDVVESMKINSGDGIRFHYGVFNILSLYYSDRVWSWVSNDLLQYDSSSVNLFDHICMLLND